MQHHLLGGAFALLAAISWACAMILFKRGGEKVPPVALNLFKNATSLALLVPTLWILEGGLKAFEAYSLSDVGILALSGFLGITVADTLFFHSLNLVGVGIVSIVDCLYMPFVIFFSWLILGERLTAVQYAGAGAILLAVYVTSRHEPPRDRTRKQLVLGIALGALNMVVMTFGIVIAKPVIERTPLVGSTILRVAAGALCLCLILPMLPRSGAVRSAFRPSRAWWVTVPGSFLGAYLALVFWMGGFKNTYASVAGTLNQTASIFALILAAVFLSEPITRRKVVAVALALAGVGLVMLPALLKELRV